MLYRLIFRSSVDRSIPSRDAAPSYATVADVLAATRAASITTSETSKGVQFTFTPKGLQLKGQSSEYGVSSVACGLAECGVECAVALDPRYVCEFLDTLDQEATVAIEAVDADSAVILRCEDSTGLVAPLSL